MFGCPTYAAGPTSDFYTWMEKNAGGLNLAGKLGGVFATEQYIHGGADLTMNALLIHLLVYGMMIYSGGASCGKPVIHMGPVEVSPKKEEIHLDEPVIIKQGSRYGVKIRSEAPSIHMIRANIETENAPIVGSEKQAEDLVAYIKKESEGPQGVWGTNIFGKSIEDLVMDGMRNKITLINEESQVKLQDSMQKIVNDSNGGLVCIII